MESRILFVVNGLGLGNSTRCYSIIQELHALGHSIDVATSNNGLLFYRGKPEVDNIYPIGSIHYGKGRNNRLNILRTMGLVLGGLRLFLSNALFLTRLIRKSKPALVVYDSQYNILPRLLTRVPIVALNNSDRIVSYFFKARNKPWSIFPQFFMVELLDSMFHKMVPHFVMSPWLEGRQKDGKFKRVGLIVREGIEPVCRENLSVRKILIMLSGSSFGGDIDPSSWNLPYHFDIVGREGRSSSLVRFHGKLVDNIPLLLAADIVVINAGFSAVSEAIALKKPTVVIPVENHGEQWVNGQIIRGLGMGDVATLENVRERLMSVIDNFEKYSANALRAQIPTNGAAECARWIRSLEFCKPLTLNSLVGQKARF